jgi:hypothetical protein
MTAAVHHHTSASRKSPRLVKCFKRVVISLLLWGSDTAAPSGYGAHPRCARTSGLAAGPSYLDLFRARARDITAVHTAGQASRLRVLTADRPILVLVRTPHHVAARLPGTPCSSSNSRADRSAAEPPTVRTPNRADPRRLHHSELTGANLDPFSIEKTRSPTICPDCTRAAQVAHRRKAPRLAASPRHRGGEGTAEPTGEEELQVDASKQFTKQRRTSASPVGRP